MRILVPLDGSETGQAVLPWVKLLATQPDSQVQLMRSYRPLEEIKPIMELALVATELVSQSGVAAKIEAQLEELAATHFPDQKVTVSSPVGPAADAILRCSEYADIIAIASHGESGVASWLMGSVTTKVVRASTKPVLVISSHPESQPRPAQIKNILVPLDGSPTAEAALDQAAKLARNFDASLLLYEGVVYREPSPDAEDWQVLIAQGYLREQAQKYPDLKIDILARETQHGPGIIDQARAGDFDLIVMGSHGRSGVARFFLGSVAEKVVQRAPCPVLIVYNREG